MHCYEEHSTLDQIAVSVSQLGAPSSNFGSLKKASLATQTSREKEYFSNTACEHEFRSPQPALDLWPYKHNATASP